MDDDDKPQVAPPIRTFQADLIADLFSGLDREPPERERWAEADEDATAIPQATRDEPPISTNTQGVDEGASEPVAGMTPDDRAAAFVRYVEDRAVSRVKPFFVQPGGPPPGWRHPVTGRSNPEPDPLLVAFGRYVLRSRFLVVKSQQALSNETGVPQSQISRLERGLAPSMGVDRLMMLGEGLGRAMPLGVCPHDHACAWQPIEPKPVHRFGR